MGDADKQSGNKLTIRKGKVKKLTIGNDIQTPDAEAAEKIIKNLPPDTHGNEARIGEAEVDDAVVGMRITIGKAADLAPHVAELAKQVDDAAAAGEISSDDKDDTHTALARVKTEIAKPKPDGRRVVDNLKRVSDVLDNVRKSGENTAKIGKVIVKAAPYAAMLFQAAKGFFGLT